MCVVMPESELTNAKYGACGFPHSRHDHHDNCFLKEFAQVQLWGACWQSFPGSPNCIVSNFA